jgi:hypothetical protein
MPGAHRTRSLACDVKMAHEHSHRRYSRIHPAFPHAMVLTVSFVLSPVPSARPSIAHRPLMETRPAITSRARCCRVHRIPRPTSVTACA